MPNLNMPRTATAQLVEREIVRDSFNGGASSYILNKTMRQCLPPAVFESGSARIRNYLVSMIRLQIRVLPFFTPNYKIYSKHVIKSEQIRHDYKPNT